MRDSRQGGGVGKGQKTDISLQKEKTSPEKKATEAVIRDSFDVNNAIWLRSSLFYVSKLKLEDFYWFFF